MKVRRFSLAIAILVVMLAAIYGAFNIAHAATVCSPATAITVPYAKDGVGDVCLVATSLCTYINSWNLTTLEVNGASYLNTYVAASSIAPLNGAYTIHYNSTVAYGHFEIAGTCGSNPTVTTGPSLTPTPLPGASRTPTAGGPTPTRTNTLAGPTLTRTPTATTGPSPTPTRTLTPIPGGGGMPSYYLGADISWVPEEEASGKHYSDGGVQKDIFQILKDHKINFIRLRIFNNPTASGGYSSQGFCDLAHVKAMALRAKNAGMKFLLDFHYSDNWADPGKQNKPAAWKNMTFAQETQALHDYTLDVVTQLKNQGTMPDMVQVGNEITNGMLWPDGGSSSGANYDNLATLVKAGIAAVKEVDPSILVMEHIDRGGDNAGARAWLDAMFARGVTFDIIGLSYYPQYQGTLAQLTSNVNDLASRYGKPIVAAEYSQSKREVNDAIHALPNGLGKGTFIWEPTSYGEPFFNSSGATIPSLIDLYPQMYTAYGITP